jgi:hypothetical protein
MEAEHAHVHQDEYFGREGYYVVDWFESLKRSGRRANTLVEKAQMEAADRNGDTAFKFHFSKV